jgi:hypothetical protein
MGVLVVRLYHCLCSVDLLLLFALLSLSHYWTCIVLYTPLQRDPSCLSLLWQPVENPLSQHHNEKQADYICHQKADEGDTVKDSFVL